MSEDTNLIAKTDTGLKLSNILNALKSWNDLTELQSSIMMFCLLKAQDNKTECSVDELRYFLPENLYGRDNKRLFKVATEMLDAVATKKMTVRIADDNCIVLDHIPSLFLKYRTYQDQRGGLLKIEFTYNPEAYPLIKDLRSQYTLLELRDYFCLKGKHTKRLYTLLRQFRTTGNWKISFDKFKDLMGCSKYNTGMFNKRVLDPALEQLREVNISLKRRIVDNYAKDGHPLTNVQIEQKEKEGLFCLFFDLKVKFSSSQSNSTKNIEFSFAPQDPKLNHEENARRYQYKAQGTKRNVNGQSIAESKDAEGYKKQLTQAQEIIRQLKAQLHIQQHPEDLSVNRPATLYKAEQPSLRAEGVSIDQFRQLSQDVQLPPNQNLPWNGDDIPMPDDNDAPVTFPDDANKAMATCSYDDVDGIKNTKGNS